MAEDGAAPLQAEWLFLNQKCRAGYGTAPEIDAACIERLPVDRELERFGCVYHIGDRPLDYWVYCRQW
jgi:hypothetical protein